MVKTNPHKIPRTQADVDKAEQRGTDFGIEFCLNLILYVMKEKHNATDEYIIQIRDEFMYQVDSIGKGYLKYRDVIKALQSEYDMSVQLIGKKVVKK